MLRIHFTAADFARVRFAPRPAPLIELNTAFMKATSTDDPLLYARWRQRLLRSLPPTVLPLRALAPAGNAPVFLDTYNDSLTDALESIRATHPTAIRSELQRIYASAPTHHRPGSGPSTKTTPVPGTSSNRLNTRPSKPSYAPYGP